MSNQMVEEIYRREEKQIALEICKGEVSSVRNKTVTRQAARLFLSDKIQAASYCGQISDHDLLDRVKLATDTAIPYAYKPSSESSVICSLPRTKEVDAKSLMQMTTQTLEYLRRQAPQFIFSGKVVNQELRTSLVNNRDLKLSLDYTLTDCAIIYKHRKSASIMDGYFLCGSVSDHSFKETIDANLPFLNVYENEVEWPSHESLPVVFSEGPPCLSKVGESLRIDRYSEGTSLYSGQLGKQIFNSAIQIEDVRFDAERAVIKPFDGEGTVRKESALPLVESGVMTHLISDLRNAAKYGQVSTGNAQRLKETLIALDFNALTLKRGAESYQDLLKKFPRCIFVIVGGGGSTSDSGEFSTPIQLAFLVENGKVIGRLPQLTARSSVQEMFGDHFIGVSKDSFGKGQLHPCFIAEMKIFKN
jgi:PmbA protein